MTDTRLINLNADEVMCLSDRVLNHDAGTEEQRMSGYCLLLKLGSAFVELVGTGQKQGGTVPIAVTEGEAWLLRSKIISSDKTATDSLFGIRLLTKLYTALLSFNGLDGLPVCETSDGSMTEQQKVALAEWREKTKED
jgi:hypothetical protein